MKMVQPLILLSYLACTHLYASDALQKNVSPYSEHEMHQFEDQELIYDHAHKGCGAMAAVALVTSVLPTTVSLPVCALHIGCACIGACAAVHAEDAKLRARNKLKGEMAPATDAIGKWIDGLFTLDKKDKKEN